MLFREGRLSTFNSSLAFPASFMTILLGNLGTIQAVFNALQRIAAPGGTVPVDANLVQRWGWAFQGIWKMYAEQALLPHWAR